jgi:hypothetical protein
MDTNDELRRRIETVEKRLREYQAALALALTVLPAIFLFSMGVGAQGQELRARSLVLEDANGRDRIVIGAPLAEPPGRISPATGIRINDPQGVERFFVGLLENDRVVMGFDAPVGKGDPRNRERISLVSDSEGGAYIRFLNRKTLIPGRLILGDDDKLHLEFTELIDGKTRIKRIGFAGEEIVDAQ